MQPVFESNGYVERFTLGGGSLRFAVKDTLDVAGFRTRAGCPALDDAPVAVAHAGIIDALLAADCTLTGKTRLHELAFGVTGINSWGGTPVNPLYPTLIPGGSSSGSAAVVAAGEVDFSLGTDTGGSVRMPAACCGVMGLKPGFGALSREGVMPANSSLDCVGLFTRDAATLREVLTRLSFRVGLPLSAAPEIAFISAAEPAIDTLLAGWLAKRGIQPRIGMLAGLGDAHRAGLTLIARENWQAFRGLLADGRVSPDVATRIRAGAAVTDAECARAEQVRTVFRAEVDDLLAQTPLLALATLPELPPTLREARDALSVVNLTRLVRPFNLSGHPALSLPAGEIAGRPVALQLVAQKGAEGLLVQAAEWLTGRRRG